MLTMSNELLDDLWRYKRELILEMATKNINDEDYEFLKIEYELVAQTLLEQSANDMSNSGAKVLKPRR